MKIQGLKRKSPNARHRFAYRYNGEVYSGLKPDYVQHINTIIRPDIDVEQDVQDINEGKAIVPDYEGEINILKKIEYKKYHCIAFVILFTCVVAFISSRLGVIVPFSAYAIYSFAVIGILGVYMKRPFISPEISVIQKYSIEPEWLVNGRVYGEHQNPEGEAVLYPKRGKGFYRLESLHYIKLYTLIFHKGDDLKSSALHETLSKSLFAQKQIRTNRRLSQEEITIVKKIYEECSNAQIL
jgi:hypothetical protein